MDLDEIDLPEMLPSQIHKILSRKSSARWAYEGDIKACFDEINHEWMLEHIPMDKQMLTKWLKAGFIEQKTWHPAKEGTPQGGIISPILANLVLDGLEKQLRETYAKTTRKGQKAKVNFVRYADDVRRR